MLALLLINAAIICTPSPQSARDAGLSLDTMQGDLLGAQDSAGKQPSAPGPAWRPSAASSSFTAFQGPASQGETPVVEATTPAAPSEPSQPPQQHSSNAKRPGKARFKIERKPVRRHPLTEGMRLPQDALREVGSMFTTAQKLGVQDVVLQRAADSVRQLFEHTEQT